MALDDRERPSASAHVGKPVVMWMGQESLVTTIRLFQPAEDRHGRKARSEVGGLHGEGCAARGGRAFDRAVGGHDLVVEQGVRAAQSTG